MSVMQMEENSQHSYDAIMNLFRRVFLAPSDDIQAFGGGE